MTPAEAIAAALDAAGLQEPISIYWSRSGYIEATVTPDEFHRISEGVEVTFEGCVDVEYWSCTIGGLHVRTSRRIPAKVVRYIGPKRD